MYTFGAWNDAGEAGVMLNRSFREGFCNALHFND
jgi:hypothetical protein